MSRVFLALTLAAASCGGSGGPGTTPSTPAPAATPAPAPAAARPLRYVALGDSTAFGIGAIPGEGGYPPRLARRLRAAGREVELTNLGVPGATAADLAERVVPTLDLFKPTLVTIGVGANDVRVGRAPADFAVAFDAICAAAVGTGAAVMAVNVPDLSLVPSEAGKDPAYFALNRELNGEIARIAAARGVVLVDLFTESQRRLAGHPEYFFVDGFHPSASGYEVWADIMWPAVEQAAASRP